MYFENADGNYVYAPDVSGLGGVMECMNPMCAGSLGAAYAMSPLLPSDIGTPVFDMNVRMPDERAVLSGFDQPGQYAYNSGQIEEAFVGAQQFNNPALNGFGAVQDAIGVLSFVDLISRA